MSDVPFQARITALEAAIRPAADPALPGAASLPELESLKGWLDDVRLDVWGKLQAAHQPAASSFEERFRVQRATELCGRLAVDLRAGRVDPQLGEFALLTVTIADLANAIRTARPRPAGDPPLA